jgi:flagellar biogenesis protein FliO
LTISRAWQDAGPLLAARQNAEHEQNHSQDGDMGATQLTLLCAALLTGLLDTGSGGPVFVSDGRAVDISVAKSPQDGAGIALPIAAPPVAEAPPNERLPLGAPPRPAAMEEAEPSGVWRAIDPRQSELVRVGGALAAVLLLLVLLRGMLRAGARLPGGGRPSGVLEVLGRYPVGRAQSLVLLKLGGRLVLVHQTRAGMSPISEVSEPQEVAALLGRVEAAGRARGSGFHGLLKRLMRRPAGEAFPLVADAPVAPGGPAGTGERVVVDLTRRRRRAPG